MKIINAHIYISTQEYAEAVKISEGAIIAAIQQSRRLYRSITSLYETTERGRITLYKLDSLCEEHQKAVRRHLGLTAPQPPKGEQMQIAVRVDEALLSEAVSSEGIEKGQKLARYAAWLLAVCPEGRQDKAFMANWANHHSAYHREWLEGNLYGQLISNPYVWVRNTQKLLKEGWKALLSGREGNQNKRKIDDAVQKAVMAIAVNGFQYMPTIPKVEKVYAQFTQGITEFVHKETGEVLSGLGYPELSEGSFRNILVKDRLNRLALEKHYASALEYRSKHEPFVWRKPPAYSLSKLTMDDKALRFNFEGGLTFWAYLVFDVYSGAMVGYASVEESKEQYKALKGLSTEEALKVDKKGVQLIKNSLLNTFQTLFEMGLGAYVPHEIESEQHLASSLKNDLLCPGVVFPEVRFCRGGNAQEKKAENFIKRFKYGVEMEYEGFKARPFLKLLQNRLNTDKKQRIYTIAQGKEMLDKMVREYNALPHHTLKSKSKWEVFTEGIDTSKLQSLNNANLAKHCGHRAGTARIHRNQYVFANEQTYLLPSASEWLDKIYGQEVQVYTLPYLPEQAWLWQGDTYICALIHLSEVLESEDSLTQFSEQRASFNKQVKEALESAKGFDKIEPVWNNTEENEEDEEIKPTRRSNKLIFNT